MVARGGRLGIERTPKTSRSHWLGRSALRKHDLPFLRLANLFVVVDVVLLVDVLLVEDGVELVDDAREELVARPVQGCQPGPGARARTSRARSGASQGSKDCWFVQVTVRHPEFCAGEKCMCCARVRLSGRLLLFSIESGSWARSPVALVLL